MYTHYALLCIYIYTGTVYIHMERGSRQLYFMREPEDVEAEFGEDSEDVVADAGNNADLNAANQGSTELINEARTEEAPLGLGSS